MGWTVRGLNPSGGEIFRTCLDQLWGPSSPYTMGAGSFSAVKRLGRGVDHPPPCSAKVKERVEPYLYSPSGPSWPVLGWTLPLPLPHYTNEFDLWLFTVLQLGRYGPHTHSPYLSPGERNNPLASDWQQTVIIGTVSPPGYRHLVLISVLSGFEPWCHSGIHV